MSDKTPFLHFVIDEDLLKRIDDFRFQHRFGSRSETIKWLLAWALDQKAVPPSNPQPTEPKPKKRQPEATHDLDSEPPILISIEEAGRMLGFKRAAAYKKFASGQIPGLVSLGERNNRVNVNALRSWIFRRTKH